MFLPMGDIPYPSESDIDDPAMIQYIMALESNLRKSNELKKITFWMMIVSYILLFASLALNLYTIFKKKHYYKMIGAYIKNTKQPPRIIITDQFEIDEKYSPRSKSTVQYNNHSPDIIQPANNYGGAII